jgi:hypothetical protein
MADIHTTIRTGKYLTVVYHLETSVYFSSSNAVTNAWKDCLLADGVTGSDATILTIGTAAWEITAAEEAFIVSGDIVEGVSIIRIDPNSVSADALKKLTAKQATIFIEDTKRKYRYFGTTADL